MTGWAKKTWKRLPGWIVLCRSRDLNWTGTASAFFSSQQNVVLIGQRDITRRVCWRFVVRLLHGVVSLWTKSTDNWINIQRTNVRTKLNSLTSFNFDCNLSGLVSVSLPLMTLTIAGSTPQPTSFQRACVTSPFQFRIRSLCPGGGMFIPWRRNNRGRWRGTVCLSLAALVSLSFLSWMGKYEVTTRKQKACNKKDNNAGESKTAWKLYAVHNFRGPFNNRKENESTRWLNKLERFPP